MIEQELDIETPDGKMNTFVTFPEEGGPFPVVLLLMDAMGKREELHDKASRLATTGFFVLLPNLYYRRVRVFDPDWSDEEKSMGLLFDHMNSLSNAMVVEDCRALLDYANHHDSATNGPAGAVGYSMGGAFAFAVATKIPERIKATASIYGYRNITDESDSPHLSADRIEGEIYFAFAENDDFVPPEEVKSLESYLSNLNINYRTETYPGTIHLFTFPQQDGYYHKSSAERHWERLHALLKRTL